jgi:dipeptidyl aminopeptidase/acylaminoacyl peptidase
MTARSPLRNIGLLKVPLLLIHGGKDGRVPPDGSREFAETASSAGKGVILREFPGQGHDLRGVENRLAEYRAIFDFLGEIPSAGGR